MADEMTDPIDVLGYEQGLEVCDQQKGWLVITGKEGDTFNPRALFFSKEEAEHYCELEIDDGQGGKDPVPTNAPGRDASRLPSRSPGTPPRCCRSQDGAPALVR